MEGESPILNWLVGDGNPLVLPQMLQPALEHEDFDISCRIAHIDEMLPEDRAVAASDPPSRSSPGLHPVGLPQSPSPL